MASIASIETMGQSETYSEHCGSVSHNELMSNQISQLLAVMFTEKSVLSMNAELNNFH